MYLKSLQNEKPYTWLNWIETGIKKYEGRLNKGEWSKMKIGDIITFYDKNNKTLKITITELKYYHSFGEAFNDLGKDLVPIDNISTDEVVKIYSEFYSDKEINEFGVVAVGVSPI